MTPNDIKLALYEVLANGVSLNATAYLVFILGWVVAGAFGAFAGAFWGKRGETAAMRRDLNTIKENLRQTTAATEEIKADISGTLWLKQRRWDRKWDCYVEIVKNLGEVHTLIREALALNRDDPHYAREFEDRVKRWNEGVLNARQFGSIARIAVAPNVRTVLTRFGNKWNKARADVMQQGIVARWGWLVITDIARNDLYGDAREMSDEFEGDVDVPEPKTVPALDAPVRRPGVAPELA